MAGKGGGATGFGEGSQGNVGWKRTLPGWQGPLTTGHTLLIPTLGIMDSMYENKHVRHIYACTVTVVPC